MRQHYDAEWAGRELTDDGQRSTYDLAWATRDPVVTPPNATNADILAGLIARDHSRAARAAAGALADQERMIARGYPEQAVRGGWTLDTWAEDTPGRALALELALAFAADPFGFKEGRGRHGLGLAGRTGRGKTGLAVGIGWLLEALAVDHAFTTWRGLMAACHAAVDRPARSGAQHPSVRAVVGRYADCGVLILDDLGDPDQEKQESAFARQVLQEVLWPRYDRGAPTVVTTNCGDGAIARLFGEAAASRLFGMLAWRALDGPDLRREGAA